MIKTRSLRKEKLPRELEMMSLIIKLKSRREEVRVREEEVEALEVVAEEGAVEKDSKEMRDQEKIMMESINQRKK